MKKVNPTLLIIALLHLFSSSLLVQKKNQPIQLESMLEQYSKEYYALNPLQATEAGINEYNSQIEITISEDYIKKAKALNQKYLTQLAVINKTGLTASQLLSIDVLTYKLKSENERLNNLLGFYRPVDQFVFSFSTKFATLGSGAGFVPFNTEKDYRDFISRMKGFQIWVDQAIANMKKGVAQNNSNPKAAMEKVPPQLKPLFETTLQQNVFYKPLLKLPTNIDSAAAIQLKKDYSDAIENMLKPAYKKLHDYITTEYIPKARTTSGLLDNEKGKKEYELWLKYYTTTNITAEQIFNLGLREVARIRKEMDSVKTQVGLKGDLKSFFEYVKTNPKFFPFKTEEEVLDRYRSFLDRMSPQLNILFNLKPKAKFEVRATEKFRAAGANAQYMPASRDGKRPGIFYEVILDPAQYNYFSMEDLFLHEAIPGHHYQSAIQQEADIPEFRKVYWTSAFGEGWALYAESLGTELGMYTDPYQYLGRLNGEIERAVRLVVDAGIHYKGWSREKAIAYVLENQPVSSAEAVQRIERYMVTAGQAVSYKVGELKIIELRERAKKKLGNRFDIKEFHDEVLKDGCLPLIILETKINRWIQSKH
ncbi:DUF885 domain-containing protein [Lacibacter sp.]|uniref:DUF885 domain-containing protein n=1 Tax=Lacibacter sp. TaxID=1915409 RepID=UPI002B4B580F|nr:DUF885 domain-containing protein [Lacibacter sp.]HLP36885.1 DUF885 domain-containing protein [Lacibacter sp.]